MEQLDQKPKRKLWLIGAIAAGVLLLAAGGTAAYLFFSPACTYTVADGGSTQTVKTFSRDAAAILRKADITLGEYDVYTEEKTQKGTVITIHRAQAITLTVEGKSQTVYTQPETVGQLLTRLNIGTSDPWQVSVPLEQQTSDGMTVQVDHIVQKPYSQVEETEYGTMYCNDPSLPAGEKEVIRPGVAGQQENVGQAVYVNGQMESVTVSETVVITEPVKEIVAVGTGEKAGQPRQYPLVGDDFLVTADGQCLFYSYVDTYNATAYTAWVADVKGTTACGTPARVGAVAVDPKVIPYFTKMYIVSKDGVFDYGISSAEDCGGAIKGKIIDLYFNTLADCYAFGRRDILVYFLTEEPS